MNILFINFGNFNNNSTEHIGGFAEELIRRGHDCIAAVPDLASAPLPPTANYRGASYAMAIHPSALFRNKKPADIIHAWTPREGVRRLVFDILHHEYAKVVVHLEDNESVISERCMGKTRSELVNLTDADLRDQPFPIFTHPIRGPSFLSFADGITLITDSLSTFVPAGVKHCTIRPIVDFNVFHPQEPDQLLRKQFAIAENEKVLYYPGGVTPANKQDTLELYQAVVLINQLGIPCKLIHSGHFTKECVSRYATPEMARFVIPAGHVDRALVPKLLALADVVVQPGKTDQFNRLRLPSKIPQFLAMGRPAIIPNTNIAQHLNNGENVLLMEHGDPGEIASLCKRIFENPSLAKKLGENAALFAKTHFDAKSCCDTLLEFYEEVMALNNNMYLSAVKDTCLTERTLEAARLARQLKDEPCSSCSQGRHLSELAVRIEHSVRTMECEIAQYREAIPENIGHCLRIIFAKLRRLPGHYWRVFTAKMR